MLEKDGTYTSSIINWRKYCNLREVPQLSILRHTL